MSQEHHSLPPGYTLIPVRTTYLEMRDRPRTGPMVLPPGCVVERWEQPDTNAYRDLFSAVGGEWGWSGRSILKEGELQAVLQTRTNEIFRMFCAGQVAGFVELDRSVVKQAEIAYFGLLPGFLGRGLGKFLLDWAIRQAWAAETQRVWLHTCQYDHASALAVYLKAGFSVFKEQIELQPYTEEFIGKYRPAGG